MPYQKIILPILLLITSIATAQVEAVEMMPGIINKPGTANTEPSFNEKQNLLCFYRESSKERAIMISMKSNNNEWSEPYTAIPFPHKSKGTLMGAKINAAGTRIYFGWKSDIYFSEYIGGNDWADALRIDEPVSTELQEDRPSFTGDEQTIAFIRNVLNSDKSDWVSTPFMAQRNGTSGWSVPKQVWIKDVAGPVEELIISQTRELIIYATATTTAYHNYYASIQDSVYENSKEFNFSSGKIRWISEDLSTGLAETFTSPRKIVKVKFEHNWFKTLSLNPISVASREVLPNAAEGMTVKPKGKYFGLLIGVSNYSDHTLNLERPVNDVKLMSELLTTKYEFSKEDMKLLLNPTRQEILRELFKLRSVVTSNDNLLIFFAGHGYWDKNISQGYWWPKDAAQNDPSFWLSNSDLREQIRGIESGHTLLISDACFSGGIFKTRGVEDLKTAPLSIQVLYKTKSRRAMTSGNLSTVPDQSVFFEYLMNRLRDSQEKFLPAQGLFNNIRTAVINNSLNIPQEGVISDAGDEGGDFIFILKEN